MTLKPRKCIKNWSMDDDMRNDHWIKQDGGDLGKC